jgi:two-component system OmpR family response regulator
MSIATHKIVLIDDDKFLLETYATKFQQNGFDVRACLSVKAGLAALKEGFPAEAIIFDIIMPEQDGFSLLEELRAEILAPDALRIALTNQSDDSEKKRAEELGVSLYIIKASMIPSEVVHTVSEALAKSRA